MRYITKCVGLIGTDKLDQLAMCVKGTKKESFYIKHGIPEELKERWWFVCGPVSFYDEIIGHDVEMECMGLIDNCIPIRPMFIRVLGVHMEDE